VQAWANEREIALIAEHGGPLRDPSVRCKQTLNLDHGGKFGMNFEARDAARTIGWLKLKRELEEYVSCYKTCVVSRTYKTSSGYPLGARLHGVRQGELWNGHSEEVDRKDWLESLPGWTWNASKDIRDNAWTAFQCEMNEYVQINKSSLVRQSYVNPVSGYPLGKRLCDVRQGVLWKGHPNEADRIEWLEVLPKWTWNAKEYAWHAFKSEMTEYVQINKSALVRARYVNPVSGYQLGSRLHGVRQGEFWKGHPEEADRIEWLESLPKWAWNGKDALRMVKWFEFQDEMNEYVKINKSALVHTDYVNPVSGYPLGQRLNSLRQGQLWKGYPNEDDRKEWLESLPNWAWNAKGTDEFKADIKKRKQDNRASVLKGLSESDREKMQKEFDARDRRFANQQAMAAALLKLPAYANKNYQWRLTKQTKAKEDGVVFFQDSSGVWCARMGAEGEG
jgi:hypothetical protein